MVFIVLLRHGPIAQLAEPPAHNRKVPGSIPGGPTGEGHDEKKGRARGIGAKGCTWCTLFLDLKGPG